MVDYLRIMLNARMAKMEERGASAVEYGLLVAGIAAVIALVIVGFGGTIRSVLFETSCSTISSAIASGTSC